MCVKRGMNEQLLKTSGTDVLSSRKKLRKTLWGGAGGGIHPHFLYVQGLRREATRRESSTPSSPSLTGVNRCTWTLQLGYDFVCTSEG